MWVDERLAFADHYSACARCAEIVADTDHYVVGAGNALKRLRSGRADDQR